MLALKRFDPRLHNHPRRVIGGLDNSNGSIGTIPRNLAVATRPGASAVIAGASRPTFTTTPAVGGPADGAPADGVHVPRNGDCGQTGLGACCGHNDLLRASASPTQPNQGAGRKSGPLTFLNLVHLAVPAGTVDKSRFT